MLLIVPMGWAQDPPPTTEGEQMAVLAGVWENYQRAKADGNDAERERVFQTFREMQVSASSEIFESAGYLFLLAGLDDLEQGRTAEARREFLNALKLNPYLWPAYGGLAKIKEKENNTGLFVELNKKGALKGLDPQNAYFFLEVLGWLFTNLYVVFAVAFSAFVFILLLKYVRPFVFTTQGAMEHRGMKPMLGRIVGYSFFCLPLLLGLNFFLAMGLYLVLFFPFLDQREKIVGSLSLLCWVLVALCAFFQANIFEARVDPLLRLHLNQFYRGATDADINTLEAKSSREGSLRDQTLFTLARMYKIRGEFVVALETYEKIPESSPLWVTARINMGNLHVLMKEFQQAVDQYKSVLDKNAKMALAHHNLSLVYIRTGNPQEAAKHRNQARDLDQGISDISESLRAGNESVIDAGGLTGRRLVQAVFGFDRPAAGALWLRPMVVVPLVSALLLLVLSWLHTRLRNFRLIAKTCEKCGMVYYQSDSPNSEWCSQCVSLYIKKEDLPSDAKIRKHEEVKAFTKRRRLISTVLQIFLPGSKNILHGSPWSGALIVSAWTFLVVMAVLPMSRLAHPFMIYLEGPIVLSFVFAILAAVFWLIFGLRPIWQED
ncbi:tetratricopeptide repeat protein [Acanthopleuribacter pedis]|uniref:Tetratricopeptide repeat protein n=1 Tax=Acanthopleuribacter pedis TaxID=442870 RepID=A0A8J7QJ04_9BACT|nr:tetratricopeptide repeat protein [Acanthopleuribacter pedis]MBO1321155.1 tetratricopeptide repeat protein [Acanthopleuribacter pedis]